MSRSKNLRILTGRISFFKVRENRGKIEFKLTSTSEWERCIDKTERTVKILDLAHSGSAFHCLCEPR